MRWLLTVFVVLFVVSFLYNRESVKMAKRNVNGAVFGGVIMEGFLQKPVGSL